MELEKEINQTKFRNDAHKLAVNIVYTFNWLNSFHVSFLKPHDLTLQQFNVLRILRGQKDHVSIKLIRERMLDKMSDASRIVEKLRVKNLVERNISSDDRRSCEVKITDKGLKILEKIDHENEKMDMIFSTLTIDEQKRLSDLLDKLRGEKSTA